MTGDLLVGIDPGANGGIAWQFDGGLVAAERMPKTEAEVVEILADLAHSATTPVAYLERVGGFIAGRPAPGSRMFNFGRGYGVLIASLITSRYRIVEITPQAWQKKIGVKFPGGVSSNDRKKLLKGLAQKTHPDLAADITLATADALLVLEAGRQIERGDP